MMSDGVEITSYLHLLESGNLINNKLTYNLMMCGCLNARIYSTSLCTLVLVFVAWMTCFEMNFIATLCPVTVCIATRPFSVTQVATKAPITHF